MHLPRSAGPRPEISVVIPTFRRPRELREALDSVAGQAGTRLEIIVVDDCPDGSARAALDGFSAVPVTYLRTPRPSGGRPATVRNLGASLARGELIHFLDDDDRVPAGHYAAVRETFRRSPDVNVVFGRVAPFGTDPDAVRRERAYFEAAARRARWCARLGDRWGYAAAMFFGPTLLVCGAAILRGACWPALGGFDPALALMEDVDLYARAIRLGGARFIDRPALHYRIGPSLMHRPYSQGGPIGDSYRRMHARYRGEHGALDLLLLKSVAKVIGA